MVTRRIRGMWHRERSRRFAVVTAAALIVVSGLPGLLLPFTAWLESPKQVAEGPVEVAMPGEGEGLS